MRLSPAVVTVAATALVLLAPAGAPALVRDDARRAHPVRALHAGGVSHRCRRHARRSRARPLRRPALRQPERVVSTLRARGALRLTAPNRPAGTLSVQDFSDPLVPSEWWRAAVGVAALTPPGPGKAVTIVDSGIDVTHPDYLNRPNT